MSNDSQEIEEHILEWGPWGHGIQCIDCQSIQEHLDRI